MSRGPKPGKAVFSAIVVVAAMAAGAACAWAQLGAQAVITVPDSVTSDQPVETATTDIDTVRLPPIVQSLTTTTNGGSYTPNTSVISTLSQNLFAGVNPQNMATLLPVTQGLPCDSYTPMITQIAPALAATYQGAITDTQQLMTELASEDFTHILANINAPAELAATQGVGQAIVALAQELQLERAQLGVLTMVIAVDRLHELDANVRARMPRQGQGCQ